MKSKSNSPQAMESSEETSGGGEIVSFSKNIFLPITNLCRNKCSYCGFREEPEEAWIMSKDEVLKLAEKGLKEGCSEALITLGERPEVYEKMKEKLEKWGYKNTVKYLEDLSREILDIGLLPHTNPGILEKSELKSLRKWNASMGLMLECVNELPAHEKSPGKVPNLRIETIEKAGELKIPFTTGILIGIGENREDRIDSLKKIKELQDSYGHIQEVIIQPFMPKEGTPMKNRSTPSSSVVLDTVEIAKEIMPHIKVQVPPNLTSNIINILNAGASDLGGISEVTPDFINPENPWPNLSELKSKLSKNGYKLKERLPIHPKYAVNPEFMSSIVKEVVDELSDEKGYRRVSN